MYQPLPGLMYPMHGGQYSLFNAISDFLSVAISHHHTKPLVHIQKTYPYYYTHTKPLVTENKTSLSDGVFVYTLLYVVVKIVTAEEHVTQMFSSPIAKMVKKSFSNWNTRHCLNNGPDIIYYGRVKE